VDAESTGEERLGSPGGVGGSEGHEGPLDTLIRVQDLDISISQLEHRLATLAERRDLEALEATVAGLDRRAAELGAQRRVFVDRQAEIEEQIAGLTARRSTLEERLYADRGSASRDLQAIEAEVRHLTQRRSDLEEIELGLMEDQEPVDAALAEVAWSRAESVASAEGRRAALAAAEGAVEAELAEVIAMRAVAARGLPTDLGDRYEVLRARLGGIGAARLVGNRCEGCHLELPSKEVDRIRHLPADTVVTCDQCGRILVRATVRP